MSAKFQAPKGTHDILPDESARWDRLERRTREIADRYGYSEVRTPIFEATDLFVRSVGEATDIVRKELGVETETEAIEKALDEIIFRAELREWREKNGGKFPDWSDPFGADEIGVEFRIPPLQPDPQR